MCDVWFDLIEYFIENLCTIKDIKHIIEIIWIMIIYNINMNVNSQTRSLYFEISSHSHFKNKSFFTDSFCRKYFSTSIFRFRIHSLYVQVLLIFNPIFFWWSKRFMPFSTFRWILQNWTYLLSFYSLFVFLICSSCTIINLKAMLRIWSLRFSTKIKEINWFLHFFFIIERTLNH